MEMNQLAQLDKSILLSIVADLTEKNNCLQTLIVDIMQQSKALSQASTKSGILFSDYMQEWLTSNKTKWQRTTFEGYQNNVCKHIVPYFFEKGILLSDISPTDIQLYYQSKLDEGLSPNSIVKHHNNLHSALILAKKDGKIASDPTANIEKPVQKPYEANFYQPEEIERLILAAQNSTILTPIILAAFLGLRRSEALGLKWDAVNFSENTIEIKRKLVRVTENGKDVLYVDDKMKTKLSRRTLCLPMQLVKYLKFIKMWQQNNQIRKKNLYNQNFIGFICVSDNGNIISPTNLSNTFSRLVQKNHFRYLRFHDLRHSCASLLYILGNGLKDIQEWLGHSNIGTTANTYIHLNFKRKATLAENLNAAIQLNILN